MSLPGAVAGDRAMNVKVAVRCRPLNEEERRSSQPMVVTCDNDKNITVSYGPTLRKTEKTFAFDRVFGTYSTQSEVFDAVVLPIVEEALDGFNCTIFAYGQTGTGKTHTMEGDLTCAENAGIVPRSVKAIFEQLGGSGAEFTIRVSFLELYNEELQDLLSTDTEKKLRLCEDVKKGLICQNLEEVAVLNVDDIFDILTKGIKLRQTAETMCNKNSSRSHSIFTMKMYIKESNIDGEEVVRHGQLNLVDLAGSECVGRSGAKNDRAREAGSINQSLLTLGRVITALVDHHGHIPYRDSKLTRLLQESLGGKAKTCIIATLSPAQLAVEETLSTLDYAHRAKNIKNAPQQNQKLVKTVHLKEYSAEIETLRVQLQLTREKNGVYMTPADFGAMENRIASLQTQLGECEGALRARNDEVKQIKMTSDALESRLLEATDALANTRIELDETRLTLTGAQRALEETRADLRASEAVVWEQAACEKLLRIESEALVVEVTRCRGSIESLQDKVDDYRGMEVRDGRRADEFLEKLSISRSLLQSSVDELIVESEHSSGAICGGISDLLSSGRETCLGLLTSIDAALRVLVGDADVSRSQLENSLSGLRIHLNSSRDALVGELAALGARLEAALRDIEEASQRTDTLLLNQGDNMSGLVAGVRKRLLALSEVSEARQAEQERLVSAARSEAIEARELLETRLVEHQAVLTEQAIEQAAALQTSAVYIEKTVCELVRAMISAHVTATSSSSASSAAWTALTLNGVTDAANKAAVTLDCLHQIDDQASRNTDIHLTEAEKDLLRAVEAIEDADVGLRDSNAEVQSRLRETAPGVTRATLDMTAALESATIMSTDVVSSTLADATDILNNVKGVASAMSEDANRSMASFSSLMNSQGEVAKQKATSHFALTATRLHQQMAGLGGLEDSRVEYGCGVKEGRMRSRGSTPPRVTFSLLNPLPMTRDLDIVRLDARKREVVKGTDDIGVYQDLITEVTTVETFAITEDDSPIAIMKTSAAIVKKSGSSDSLPSESKENVHPQGVDESQRSKRSKSVSRLRPPSFATQRS